MFEGVADGDDPRGSLVSTMLRCGLKIQEIEVEDG